MKPRSLAAGERLWAQGEPARTIAIVETGRLAIRDDRAVFGLAFPGTVLGESAILSLGGPAARRTADVVAVEASSVSEYPIAVVKDAFGVGTPRLILRTLFGQICRNSLLVIVQQPARDVGPQILTALLQSLASQERTFQAIAGWDDFLVAFRVLYELRDASDALRRELTSSGPLPDEALERAAHVMRTVFSAPDSIEYVRHFLEAEQQRRTMNG
jgi:hypothetical protein